MHTIFAFIVILGGLAMLSLKEEDSTALFGSIAGIILVAVFVWGPILALVVYIGYCLSTTP